MCFRRTRRHLDFRTQKVGDLLKPFMADRARSVQEFLGQSNTTVDHVLIDAGPYAAAGSRFLSDLVGPERDYEVSRYLLADAVKAAARRFKPRKSLSLFVDGSDPIWKCCRLRTIPHKKTEGRFQRSAASPLSFAIEERAKFYLTDTQAPVPTFLVSGPSTPGPVECKMSQWALDAITRSSSQQNETSPLEKQQQQQQQQQQQDDLTAVTRKDHVVLIGGGDIYLQALAMTPFHNITMLCNDKAHYKGCHMSDLLEWHAGLSDAFQSGDNKHYCRARVDLTLCHIIGDGCSCTEMGGLNGAQFRELLDKYLTFHLPAKKYLTTENAETGRIEIVPAQLDALLSRVTNMKLGGGREEPMARDYLEVTCQGLAAFCDGGIKNYGFVPPSKFELAPKGSPPQPTVQQVIMHLRTLKKNLAPSVDDKFAMTPAEMLLVSSIEADWIDSILPAYTGGHPLPAGISKNIVETTDVLAALKKSRDVLSLVDKTTHAAHMHAPSHVWTKKQGHAGPPAGFEYASVNLGELSRSQKTRERLHAAEELGVGLSVKVKNSLVSFTAAASGSSSSAASPAATAAAPTTTTTGWEPTNKPGQESSDLAAFRARGLLKIVDWNVQFNRYSGQQTPLGKPGVNWCSATRYVALAKVLATTDADIIGMQECEAPWWDFLSRQAWVQQNYSFSTAHKGEAINPWGTMMLVHRRVPVAKMDLNNLPGHAGHTSFMPTCTVELSDKAKLSINCCHLLAPYMQANIESRTKQIETLLKMLSPKRVGEDVVVMGDFNDYPTNFFVMPAAMGGFRDAWEEVHGKEDGDAGWTINGRRNAYTSLIIEPEYYGRPDRVLLKSKNLKVQKAELIGTRCVREELGIESPPEYLWPSDHFGTMFTMEIL